MGTGFCRVSTTPGGRGFILLNLILVNGFVYVRPEMTMDSRFHKVELMLGERAAHGQPTAHLGTVKNSPNCLLDQDCP